MSTFLNLAEIPKPFKKSGYEAQRKPRSSKQLLMVEKEKRVSLDTPTWTSTMSPPSIRPSHRFCDITGLPTKYKDPRTGLFYYNAEVYRFIQSLPVHVVQQYLALRRANTVLK